MKNDSAESVATLLVEDEERLARPWAKALRRAGHSVTIAASLAEAQAQLPHHAGSPAPFDLVILDLNLPDGSGTTLLPVLERLDPAPQVAIVSGFLGAETILELLGRCRVALPKPLETRSLLQVVALAASRGCFDRVLARFAELHKLSPRERDLLSFAARGTNNKEAAALLGCAPGTVATHWKRLLRKTGQGSQRDVLSALLRYGLQQDGGSA